MYQKLGKKVEKKFNLMAIFTLLVIMLSTTVFAVDFLDLSKEHWAYEPIMEMANRGILNGYPDSTFLPDNSITRAEFAKVLVLALNLKSNGKEIEFQDVASDDWAYKYIQAAAQYLSAYRDDSNNLIYMPNGKAVREDIAVAIVIASGHEKDKYSLKTLDKFSDKEEISSDLRKYVAIAVENGLMSGHADGTFEPKGYLTRAQVSKLMKNIEDFQNKVVIKEEDDSSKDEKKYTSTKIEKEYFTDISFDSKTLKLDLGKDWDKYQYCVKNHEKNTYVPSQRYLQYQSSDSTLFGKDSETGKSRSPMYGYFGGGEKSTFKIMLKENPKKYTLIELNDPFYVSKFVKKAYTQNDEKYIEIVVNATNNLIKAEYKIENGNWVEDIDAISGKKASFVINVTKYDDDDSHKITVKLTDEYGNVGEKSDDFKIEKEYFTDISFDSKTLKLDLGKDWDKYQYSATSSQTIYVPSQRYLIYNGILTSKKDEETGYNVENVYWYISQRIKEETFKIMLKNDPETYITIKITNPFYVEEMVNMEERGFWGYYANNGEPYITEVVDATNKLSKVEYSIDNDDWRTDTTAINGNRSEIRVNVKKYKDGTGHDIKTRWTDEYGNIAGNTYYFKFD